MLVPINLAGGSYRHKSLPLSAQVTRNFWPQKVDNDRAKSTYILESWPGLTSFGSATGVNGGMFEHRGTLYKVTGGALYSVSSAGTHTSLGTVGGTGLGVFDAIGTSVIYVRGGVPYVWDGVTLTTVTDIDLEAPQGVAVINNQAIYDGNNGRFCVSDVGVPGTIQSLNYATAETFADDLLRAYVFDERVLLFGSTSIEKWWNSGVGNPPFDREQGGTIKIGLGAVQSIASNQAGVYFLGNDLRIYRLTAGGLESVSNRAIHEEIKGYSSASDAIGFCFTKGEQYFYQITFPAGNKTFIYPEGGEWVELSSGVDGGKYNGESYAYCYGKHLIADDNGGIFELDDNAYTENGATIRRVRDSAPLHGGLFGKPGKTLTMTRFELIMETGTGLVSGQGIDPVVMLSFSDDGGRAFSTETWGSIGRLGQFMWRVEWFCLGAFDARIVRISITDPVKCIIHSAAADIEVGI